MGISVSYTHLDVYKRQILSLPQVGDEQILRYTRWYSQAAVMLTKSDVTGRVITMGYHELNQRDSFCTSFVHLSFWPKLEQAMLRESCLWQREDGKLPTTILPKYERETDVDINEYFCLRIARYFHWHRDLPFLRECWPHFCRSVEFLLTLDRDGDGLPEQAPPENPLCFWADWKDVKLSLIHIWTCAPRRLCRKVTARRKASAERRQEHRGVGSPRCRQPKSEKSFRRPFSKGLGIVERAPRAANSRSRK